MSTKDMSEMLPKLDQYDPLAMAGKESPKLDRDEVLRVAMALAGAAVASSDGIARTWQGDFIETRWDLYVNDAIELIKAVNKRMEGLN